MRVFLLSITLIVSFHSIAQANYCSGVDFSDSAIQADLDEVADEINSYIHKEKAMKFAYRKLTRIDMKLRHGRGRIATPNIIDDQLLLDLLADIADEITTSNHKNIKLYNVRRQLAAIKYVFRKKRTGEQSPVAPALIEFNLSGPLDFGDVPVFSSSSTALLITQVNIGSVDATNISISSFSTNVFSVISTNCGSTLAAGASCQIEVGVSPEALGLYSEIFEINYFNGIGNDVASKEFNVNGI